MADGVPERTLSPAGWQRIGTFDRMETSFGITGPGEVFVPGTEDPEDGQEEQGD